MDIMIFLYVGLLVGTIYLLKRLMRYFDKKGERKMEENQEQQQEEEVEDVLATRNLLMSILREMGCQPEINEEAETVEFQYQGGFFYCYVEDKRINIVFPEWSDFDISDVNINDIYVTINKIHKSRGVLCRIICTVEENAASLMSVSSTVFTPEISFLKELLAASLEDLFFVKHLFYSRFYELKK